MDRSRTAYVHFHPQIHGGAWVFRGTRVNVECLVEAFAAGDSIEDILTDYPSLTREVVEGYVAQLAEIVGQGQQVGARG